jgi:phosphoglycolate phosphatase
MSAPFQAIVFDLDGTLVDSVPDVRAALNRTLSEEGRKGLSIEEVKGLVGWGAAPLVEKALVMTGKAGSADQVIDIKDRFLADYRLRPSEHTVLYPGVRSVLDRFYKEGVNMGICTNKPVITTTPVLEAFDLGRYFSAIVCGDKAAYPKPDGRHVIETLEKMKAGGKSAVMVGDSESDITAAKNAGIPAIAVTYGYCHGPLDALEADRFIDDFSTLPDVLKSLALS